jgi:hypothetical protein
MLVATNHVVPDGLSRPTHVHLKDGAKWDVQEAVPAQIAPEFSIRKFSVQSFEKFVF